MFGIFSRLHQGDGPVRAEPVSRSWPRAAHFRVFIPMLIIIVLLSAGLLIAVTGHWSASCQVGYGGHAAVTGRAQAVACAPGIEGH
jgi:hypothetical protein